MITRVESQGANWTWYTLLRCNDGGGLYPDFALQKDGDSAYLRPYANSSLMWRMRNYLPLSTGNIPAHADLVYIVPRISSFPARLSIAQNSGDLSCSKGIYDSFYDTNAGKLQCVFCPKGRNGTLLRQYSKPVYPQAGNDHIQIDYYHSLTNNDGNVSGMTYEPSFFYLQAPGYNNQLAGRYYAYTVTYMLSFVNFKIDISQLDIIVPVTYVDWTTPTVTLQTRNLFGYGTTDYRFFHSKTPGNDLFKVRSNSDGHSIMATFSTIYYASQSCNYVQGSCTFTMPFITFPRNSITWDYPAPDPSGPDRIGAMTVNMIETVEGWLDDK